MKYFSWFSMRLFAVCFVALLFAPLQVAAAGKGARALLQNGEKLSLSSEQKEQINAIIRKTAKEFNRVRQAGQGTPNLAAKLDGLRKASQLEALELLTAEQRKTWDELASSSTQTQTPQGSNRDDAVAARSLIIPTIEEMRNPPSQGAFGASTTFLETEPHPSTGEGYLILTDHQDADALEALERLAKHREGQVVSVESLGELFKRDADFKRLAETLRELNPKFVAVAPVVQSYRENLHLCLLKLLVGLDGDPELDVFFGYLMASDSGGLAKLVDRSINYQPLQQEEISPASIGAIEDMDARRYRSYQKAKVMQRMFADQGTESPAIIITTRESHTERSDFPNLDSASHSIAMLPTSERHTFRQFSAEATNALNQNNLLFMFGHGTPDRIVGARADAFSDIAFENEIVFCGSCYSASPYWADRLDLSDKRDSKRFAFHAADNGAIMILGHMGLCGGFPVVYPMAEHILEGLTVGEAYQRIMNARIGGKAIPAYYPEPAPKRAEQRSEGNGLLYVVWGDPALTLIEN
ncbi:MAG: hypothetical protein AAF585_26860 [Verrucomicrobiota bacterium]